MKKEIFVMILCCLISIGCLVTMFVRCTPFEGLDLFNTCIAVLTFFITAYVGVQIYQAITLKRDIKTMIIRFKEEVKVETKEIIENRIIDYDHEISGALYQILGMEQFNRTQYDNALNYFILGIKEQNIGTKKTYTDGIISFLERYPIENIHVHLTKQSQDFVINVLAECKHEKSTDLIRYFSSLPLQESSSLKNQNLDSSKK